MSIVEDSPLSQRIPIARLELASETIKAVTDELDADSKALLVEFAWSDLTPPPAPGHRTTYTLEWDEKPIVLPLLEGQPWEWDAPIEVPSKVVYDGTVPKAPSEEETVLIVVLIPGSIPHINKVYLRQQRDAIAPPIAASTELDENNTTALEIPVKTLPPTYPLSSEFLGANYRYIADLILRDVSTAPSDSSKRGILHTLFAVRRLEEISNTEPKNKILSEEKAWIESEFGVTLERLNSALASEISLGQTKSPDTLGSPGATAKEWAPQSVLASTDESSEVLADPPVQWRSSPASRSPAATTPSIKPIHPPQDGTALSEPSSALAGLGLVTGPKEVSQLSGGSSVPSVSDKKEGKHEDDEEDLFQLPLSPRSPDMESSPFTEFRGDMPPKGMEGFQGSGAVA